MDSDFFSLRYWSWGHRVNIILPFLCIFIFYLILKNRTAKTQKIVISILMMINVIQHLFKPWFWYSLYLGEIDIDRIFFCNVCASIILLSPVTFLCKNKALKDATFFLGVLGGIFALWFITEKNVKSITHPDYIRFLFCHTLLMTTSSLPVLLGLHKLNIKNFWIVGLSFYALQIIVVGNNMLIYAWNNNFDWGHAYQHLYKRNELFICHPPASSIYKAAFGIDLQSGYMVYDSTRTYIPIFWNFPIFFPLLSLFTLIATWLMSYLKIDEYYLASRKFKIIKNRL